MAKIFLDGKTVNSQFCFYVPTEEHVGFPKVLRRHSLFDFICDGNSFVNIHPKVSSVNESCVFFIEDNFTIKRILDQVLTKSRLDKIGFITRTYVDPDTISKYYNGTTKTEYGFDIEVSGIKKSVYFVVSRIHMSDNLANTHRQCIARAVIHEGANLSVILKKYMDEGCNWVSFVYGDGSNTLLKEPEEYLKEVHDLLDTEFDENVRISIAGVPLCMINRDISELGEYKNFRLGYRSLDAQLFLDVPISYDYFASASTAVGCLYKDYTRLKRCENCEFLACPGVNRAMLTKYGEDRIFGVIRND